MRPHALSMHGVPLLPEEITSAMFLAAFRTLSRGECRVLQWLIQGKQDAAIAPLFGLATATVSTHVRNILGKLGVESRAAAIVEVWRVILCGAPPTMR